MQNSRPTSSLLLFLSISPPPLPFPPPFSFSFRARFDSRWQPPTGIRREKIPEDPATFPSPPPLAIASFFSPPSFLLLKGRRCQSSETIIRSMWIRMLCRPWPALCFLSPFSPIFPLSPNTGQARCEEHYREKRFFIPPIPLFLDRDFFPPLPRLNKGEREVVG